MRIIYACGLLILAVMLWAKSHEQRPLTQRTTSGQYWYVQKLDDGRVLVGCGNGTPEDPADATIRPTDIQNEIIIDCGTK